MMGIKGNRLFAFFVLVSLPHQCITSLPQDLKDCQKKVDNIGGALGTLLVIETIFCCYVLFCWARNLRFNLKRKERKNTDPEQDESGYPMYTDADEGTTQDQTQKRPRNGQLLSLFPQPGVAHRPGHQDRSRKQQATEKNPGKRLIERLMAKRHNRSNRPAVQDLETTVLPSNEQVVEEDVGGLVYSEPYEDKVSAASELMSRNPGSFRDRGKTNKEPTPEVPNPLVYYHVLEESTECDANLQATPTKPLPFVTNDEAREDVYYYRDSSNPENKRESSNMTPSKPLPFAPTNLPEDDVYYSCVGEESTNNPSPKNPKKALLPALPQMKSCPNATTSGLVAVQQKPDFNAHENQSRIQKPEPANKKPLKPLNSNPMMNPNMIQEMKNRVANKKSGN